MQQSLEQVPHLITALSGQILALEKTILDRQVQIETWLRQQWRKTPPPFYCSVDLRNAGFKLAPVDTNLFPAGFNNLNPDSMPLCIQAVQSTLEQHYTGCQRILLIPESHTRNSLYMENVAVLQEILMKAGFAVRLGSMRTDLQGPQTLALPSGKELTLEPLQRQNNRLGVDGFSPCLILLNHDLSDGIPAILQDIEQPIIPPLQLGWAFRRKSDHFTHYQNIAAEFAELIGIDPWLIDPYFRDCGELNFMEKEGEDCLFQQVDAVFQATREKYQQYGIDKEPFVVVKADNGTYGMGVLIITDPAQVRQLNRKQRKRMAVSKGGHKITQVLVQEGVYSFETIGPEQAAAEPVAYMIGQYVTGGFYRVHNSKGAHESLNAPGMHFVPLGFANPCNNPDPQALPDSGPNRFYAYGVIARLALLAAAREVAEGDRQ